MFKLNTEENKAYKVEVEGAVYTGAPLPASRVQALTLKHTATTFKKGKPDKQFNAAGFSKELFAETVTAWEGMADEKGEALPCTAESKALLYEKHPTVAAAVLEAFDEAVAAEAKAIEKN